MKLYNLIVIAVLLSSTVSTATFASQATTELMTNGGFESGKLTGWSLIGDATVIHYLLHSGRFSAQLGSRYGTGQLSQDFKVPAGFSGKLSFWYLGVPGDYGTAALVVSLIGPKGELINRWNGKIDFRWHQITYDIPSQYSDQTITFQLYGQSDLISDFSDGCMPQEGCGRPRPSRYYLIPVFVFVDDVSVTYG